MSVLVGGMSIGEYVMSDERFQKFLSDAGAEATIEKFYRNSCPGYQVRLVFLR